MSNKFFTNKTMWLVLLIVCCCLFSNKVQANDYLEKDDHYKIYATGINKIHFVIPVWAYGKSYDYYAYDDSYICYTPEGGSETRIAWYKTDKYDENENKDSNKGTAYVKLLKGQGDIIVTSMANGVNYQVPIDIWTGKMYVTQKELDNCPQVTVLELDWYIPVELEGKKFSAKIVSKFRRSYTDGNAMTTTKPEYGFEGTVTTITPQLYTPYLYTLNEKGVAGYGYAAVPYMVFQEPVKYYNSFDPSTVWDKDIDRSGIIYVPTNDTVQKQLSATFTVVRNSVGSTVDIKSTAQDIPPYHRIYDFAVKEETDSTGTFTGNNVLTWNIKNPLLKDLIDNDYFEVQRALESDFSDAKRVDIVQMVRDNIGQYTSVDGDRSTWTGNTEDKNGSYHLTARDNKYIVVDAKNSAIAEIDATLHARDISIPGVPVYYRIRRASSSMWDWDMDFTKTATLFNQNFLAPLATTQEAYQKDADYVNNHKVNFRFKIENKEPVSTTIDKSKCDLTYSVNRVLKEQMVDVTFSYKAVDQGYDSGGSWRYWHRDPTDYTSYRIFDTNGKVYADWQKYSSGTTYKFPINYTIEVKLDNRHDGAEGGDIVYTFVLKSNCKIESNYSTSYTLKKDILKWKAKINYYENPIATQINVVKQTVIDSLYTIMQQTNSITYGRCMWDRTAQLVLQRTIEETGQTMEFIIPQDSIRRQEDGSWLATYSDIADQGCSHYKYSVRIDQSRCDLHVQDSASLNPIQISGPSLYFDEAATITRFEATQGDATTAMKPGVLLRWETNSNAVDEFILLRKLKNSDAAPDTIYRGINYDYFDRSAVPDQHYDYTIVATYTCNGNTTSNSQTTEGWRTPYGEISGTINMPDNSGMAGVTVQLQDGDGNIIRTIQTDASGAYKFDSLEYANHIETKSYTYEEISEIVVDSTYKCEDPKVKIAFENWGSRVPKENTYIRILSPDGVVLKDWHNNINDSAIYSCPTGSIVEAKYEVDINDINPYRKWTNSGQIYSFVIENNSQLICSIIYDIDYINDDGWEKRVETYTFSANIKKISDRCRYVMITELVSTLKVDTTITISIVGLNNYSVIPTHTYGTFSFNNTSAATASITLSQDNAVASGIDFVNTSAVRLTGRVLYKSSTIPVPGAMFLLNGDTVRRGVNPLTSGIDGNFELLVPKSQPCRLQVFKTGHTFEGDGILHVEGDAEEFALTKALDGVRFYDETKVRLVGRVAGGNAQRDLPHGVGLGNNNLGDDLQLVLQLEGDNTAHFVHDPDDLSRDTIEVTTPHIIYSTDPLTTEKERTVGTTHTTLEKKRIIINPDPLTGEYAVDLFPVKYKVVQAMATGYATLFANGQGSETFDLTNAPLQEYVATFDAKQITLTEKRTQANKNETSRTYILSRDNPLYAGDSIHYNAIYDRIYHTPVQVSLRQVLYGIEKAGFGEENMEVSSMSLKNKEKVRLYTKPENGPVNYLLGYPVFMANRKYQFIAYAYERYYYNNDPQSGKVDEVPQRGGKVRVHNGLLSATDYQDYALDNMGENKSVMLEVKDIDTESSGEKALRSVSTALQVEGNWVETEVFRAFVSGTDIQPGELMQTPAAVVLLDVIRDPGGAGSSSWVESGTTYNFSYTESYDWEVGVELTPQWGVNISQDIGAVAAPEGAGSYIGSTYESSRLLSFTIPITHEWKWGYKYNYQFTTNERISTSGSSGSKSVVGSGADVFLGTTLSQLAGKAKTIAIVSDSMYTARKPAIDAGVMKVLGHGTTADGKRYHLVTGQQIVLGTTIPNTFVYTQSYILNTVIPKLALERMNLLMDFPDSLSAQQYADNAGVVVYWNKGASAANNSESMSTGTYRMLKPAGKDFIETDRIAALNTMIADWVKIIYLNEKEKVDARMAGRTVGTWSVSAGATISHSDNYTATAGYNEMPQSAELFGFESANNASKTGQKLLADMEGIVKFFKGMSKDKIGTSVADALNQMANQSGVDDPSRPSNQDKQSLGTKTNESKFSLDYNPVFVFDSNDNSATDKTIKKSAGFTFGADAQGDITVSVYRAELDTVWGKDTEQIRDNLVDNVADDYRYGSYVFFTQAGSSYCPHEDEEKTLFYNAGTILNNETQWVHKPELSIDTHEQTAVMPDKRASFRITMMNNGQLQTGSAMLGTNFYLSLIGDSNPNGAKVYMDGAPLITEVPIWLIPGQAVTKVFEVERGLVDDYDNLTLMLSLGDCPKTNTTLNFSVHFLPVSSDVSITMPRQNWIMNTLSQQDSTGYYIPVEIDGFDIHHKNFDHIEFQYKLSTESEEMWVNQCSFYANDSLYDLATGSKAMIRNGRIEPFRFYGERDPMEQRYDLRAVAFCRYGSGFVTKASPVISGTKDTRPPQVFGVPEPANAILGVGDNLKLRFNEPIAGNYLDEDNNFQLLGITNETDFTADASVHFTGSIFSLAQSMVKRDLNGKSFSIDMMVKPTSSGVENIFFEQDDQTNKQTFTFGINRENKLYVAVKDEQITSKVLEPMLEFTRVVMTYDHTTHAIRFYAGTQDMTDENAQKLPDDFTYQGNSQLLFGRGLEGNMLEARIWTKVLTQEEIAVTNRKRLTGYEKELLAYYPMSEGRGTTIADRAHGATLYMGNASWNLPKGISLAVKADEQVQLNGNLMGRSKIYDETLMFWFRPVSASGDLFKAGHANDSVGTLLALVDGNLVLHSDKMISSVGKITDNEWHHFVLTVNRTYNNASVFLDGKLTATFPAVELAGISGAMYLGGNGFVGNFDEFVIFEQALPQAFVETYDNISPAGDEMGLMAYLPFEEQKQNANGVLELVFSTNDQRVFRDANGNVVDKVVPLVVENQPSLAELNTLADKANYAPVRSHGLLSKLYFGWAFNDDELLINIKNADREINKQSMFITVRDVEDLNGNPMPSPAMWTAFVDHNSLKWDEREVNMLKQDSRDDEVQSVYVSFTNHSGNRHQFTIESLPQWLTVSPSYGSIDPMGYQTLRFIFADGVPVGEYSDLIYLTDEKGLSEPLQVQYNIEAICPYAEPDKKKYPLNMSICGMVLVDDDIDTDSRDKIIALHRNECVGMANVKFNEDEFNSKLFLTVYGNEQMKNKQLKFLLWQASTGKTFNLSTSLDDQPLNIKFADGNIIGCGADEPVIFSTGGSETQNITLDAGWNWTSFNINVRADKTGVINNVMTAAEPWTEGDLIKNTITRNFCVYSDSLEQFTGSLYHFHYIYSHMIYCEKGNTMRVSGDILPDDSMHLTIRGGGVWSPLPCLLQETTTITDALADYYDNAAPGDVIKSHDRFAVFSQNRRWEGDLTHLRPGVGYFMRRVTPGDVVVNFYNKKVSQSAAPAQRTAAAPRSAAPRSSSAATVEGQPYMADNISHFRNPRAATNMTMIATVAHPSAPAGVGQPSSLTESNQPILTDLNSVLRVYVGSELAAVAQPIVTNGDTLFFLTIQSDNIDDLHFEMETGGSTFSLSPTTKLDEPGSVISEYNSDTHNIRYSPNSHCGSLKAPVLLKVNSEIGCVQKRIINGKLYIFTADGRVYNAQGMLVANPL